MAYWLLAGGVALLIAGSEAALRGAASFGRGIGLSALLTGLLFLSFVACGPQAAMTLVALKSHARELIVPALVGSNIVCLLLILGLSALAAPLSTSPKVLIRDGGTLFAAVVLLAFLAMDGSLGRNDGIVLAALAILFLVASFATDFRRSPETSPAMQRAEFFGGMKSAFPGLLLFILGMALLGLGASFAFVGAMSIAREVALPTEITSLVLLAIALAAPAVWIALAAAIGRRSHLIVGHFFGLCLFNILFVIGGAAILRPLPVSAPVHIDIVVLLAASALLLPMLATRWRLGRLQGSALLVCYMAYLGFLGWNSGLVTPAMIGL